MTEFGLAEIEEGDGAPVLAVVADGPRRCLCGRVTLGDAVVHREGGCTPIVTQRAAEAGYPAPEVTSRDPWDGTGAPSTVAKQAERARAASWDVRVQRSRGNAPHATHGAPGALKWRYAIVLRQGDASAYAVHDGTGWVSVMLWGANIPWFPYASITDLGEYVDAGGKMDDRWFASIRDRVIGAAGRAKARAACNVGRHMEVSIDGDVAHCSVCGNEWLADGEPWRRVVTGKKEGAR
jgi:hypothetical protein